MKASFPDTSYGFVKRVHIFSSWIEQARHQTGRALSILDYGCGTGVFLTFPLGQTGNRIMGVDPHPPSIDAANRLNPPENVTFRACDLDALLQSSEKFDVIICSEVLEHLHDPQGHLKGFRSLLYDSGLLILSIPNGYGPFEQLKRLEKRLDATGINAVIRVSRQIAKGLARRLNGSCGDSGIGSETSTLNESSPHVQIFTLDQIIHLCVTSGYEILEIRGRTFLCGPYVDLWLNHRPFRWLWPLNDTLADWLPKSLCSDWMLLLRKNNA